MLSRLDASRAPKSSPKKLRKTKISILQRVESSRPLFLCVPIALNLFSRGFNNLECVVLVIQCNTFYIIIFSFLLNPLSKGSTKWYVFHQLGTCAVIFDGSAESPSESELCFVWVRMSQIGRCFICSNVKIATMYWGAQKSTDFVWTVCMTKRKWSFFSKFVS